MTGTGTPELLARLPGLDALPDYYHGYLARLEGESEVLPALERQGATLARGLASLEEEEERHRYASEKWSVREVLGHLLDTERVFQLRALWFARGDTQPLPGFDENAWAEANPAHDLTMVELLPEYRAVRASTLLLFGNFSPEQLGRTGRASGQDFQVAALAWFILAHERHHMAILQDRYGVEF